MAYLEPSEYVAYGLGADTSDVWVAAASSMIEAHCRRTSLLITAYTERLRVHRTLRTAQLSYGPVAQITAIQARHRQSESSWAEGLTAYALAFGVPGQWVPMDPTSVALDSVTGEVQLPWNLLGLCYSEVEVTYTAGFAAIPNAIKFACAQVVKNAQTTPGMNVKSSRLDTLQTEYFSDSLLDSQVKALLRPYVSERMG